MISTMIVEVLSAEGFHSSGCVCVLFVLAALSVYSFMIWSRGLRLIIMGVVDRRSFLTIFLS